MEKLAVAIVNAAAEEAGANSIPIHFPHATSPFPNPAPNL
jgi:hypothetical protein